jgi:hypothetical protein
VSNGDGLAERDYSHVTDVALAFRLAIEFDGHELHQVYITLVPGTAPA